MSRLTRIPFRSALALMLLCFALGSSGCASPQREAAAPRDRLEAAVDPHTWHVRTFALLIGNGDYPDGWKPLPGALTDVQEVAGALLLNGVETRVLTNLTRAQTEVALADFFFNHGQETNHHLLVYIAGHGYTEKLITGELMGSLVMSDTPPPDRDLAGFRQYSLPLALFEELARKARAPHVLFIFDACFSGSIFENAAAPAPPGSDQEVLRRLTLPVRQFITSGNQTDVVPDYSQFKQVLVNFLTVEGAEPRRDGYLTGTEIGAYMAAELPKQANPQHPQYGTLRDNKLNQGDFVLRLHPSIAPPPPGTAVPVRFVANREGASVFINRERAGKIRGGSLDLSLQPGRHHLVARNFLSTDRPVERMIDIENVWTQQVFEIRFESGAPPPPP